MGTFVKRFSGIEKQALRHEFLMPLGISADALALAVRVPAIDRDGRPRAA
jgi:hypothetical protein